MSHKLHAISAKALVPENEYILELINYLKPIITPLSNEIENKARRYIQKLRNLKSSSVESFMHQYSLTTAEGVAIICIAEALLRIPDSETAKDLIEDKIRDKEWTEYIGKSDSFLINASTWGLIITGKLLDLRDSDLKISKIINRLGENVVLASLKAAIKMLSNEFILSTDITGALHRAKKYRKLGYGISYDILGESSRNVAQAEHYYNKYLEAIDILAQDEQKDADLYHRTNLSVKLSALHPRVELAQYERLDKELLPRLFEIVERCKRSNITISFDAEEAFRQDTYLDVVESVYSRFNGYDGIGFVLQAYSKRTFAIIDYICNLTKAYKRKVPVRLVKGAYWDSEIKLSQEQGLEGYPVFTHKVFTDISYLACATKMIENHDKIYAQFATHNAYTIAAIQEISKGVEFEFQKLHGMGNNLHSQLIAEGHRCRIYSPIGEYNDLLAYLMRRILENNANTSFLHQIHQEEVQIDSLVINPIKLAEKILRADKNISSDQSENQSYSFDKSFIPSPANIFPSGRKNSIGYEIGIENYYITIQEGVGRYRDKQYEASSVIRGVEGDHHEMETIVVKPHNHNDKLGVWYKASQDDIAAAIEAAHNGFRSWAETEVELRANILERYADLLQENRYELYSLLINEAGKNIRDCIGEVREAIDFARYYALEGRKLMTRATRMPSYTGETNWLSLHPKGIFVCISPWNFPLAIFCGQILAALVTGNSVIAKPSENTSLIASFAIKLLYKAGLPTEALQLLLGSGRDIGNNIMADERITGLCFTGSTTTAMHINRVLANRNAPIATIIAETGGQNAMIIDSSALTEQVSDSAVYSAFGSAGQRCSALRVLYVQKEVYQRTLDMIKGSMNELAIGDTNDFSNDIGPVISLQAANNLRAHVNEMRERGFNVIEHKGAQNYSKGEDNSFFYPHIIEVNSINDIDKENFGPIMHIAPFTLDNLDKVIGDINNTGFGLTFGVQSRLHSRIEHVVKKIQAGNIYVNRSIIAAQVESQPFGGEHNSGTGFKAGGPHYLLKFLTERTVTINDTAVGGNLDLLGGKC